ncbi:TonB-dependent receptor [Marinicauda algicola]|uniref:TonB-dependent receptor n=1 Tax=Marinicauda algicola TaxID=2029849 RepID=A0A4S2H583_9PROT|nr:TonB-dependent receptor [Marinicauda algicola]TGY90598.1 TonB-dependent receptor [Marinicauda algicola]
MFKCLAVSSTALLAASSAAFAQTSETHGDVVVVTGTRFETSAERLPAEISVISREEIELEVVETLPDALAGLPGVSVVQNGPAGSLTSVFIRGANSKHTLALYDGIRLNDPSSANGIFNFGSELVGDAQRIELVRGPLSSLYGSDAIGGVVNILPRIGGETGFEPFASLSVGEFSTWRGLAGAAGTAGNLSYSLSAEGLTTDGYDVTPDRMATSTGDPDGAEFAAFTANGEYALNEAVTLEALLRVRQAETEFDTFSGGPTGFQRADDSDLKGEDAYTVWRTGLRWAGLGGRLTSRLRAGQVLNELDNFDGGALTDTYEGERSFAEWLNVWTPPGRGALVDPRISAGIAFENEDITTRTAFNAPLSVEEDHAGVFAVAQAGFGPRLDVTASARVDSYEGFDTATTGNVGAVVHLPELGTRLTGAVGTAFKAPTLFERFASSPFVTPNPDLQPEESTSWEIGFDTALAAFGRTDALAFGATWFDSEIDDLIENVFDFSTFTGQNRNVGKAEIEGYEAFAGVRPAEGFEARVSYTYTDAVNAVTGARLLRRAPHRWTASARWSPSERATLSLDYVFVGERRDVTYDDAGFFSGSGNLIDAYELVNLSGELALREDLELFGAVKNLLDETYEEPAAFAGTPRAVTIGLRLTR